MYGGEMRKRQSENMTGCLIAALTIFGVYWILGKLQVNISPIIIWMIIFAILGLAEWIRNKMN